jgi:hypothetical protein
VPLIVLLAAMAAASLLIVHEERGLTFFRDEWIFLLYRDGHDLENLLSSHAGHLVLWPAIFYVGMFKAVGPDSYGWWLAAALAIHLIVAGLLYMVARPRIGPVAALAPPIVILFLGSSSLDLMWPFQMQFTGAIACGLVALLAINRGTLGGDILAFIALLVTIGWSGVAVPFLGGAAIGLIVGRRFWARCWVVLLPSVLLGIWVIKLGQQHVDYLANLADVPSYVVRLAGAGVSGITGLPQGIAIAIAVLLSVLSAWRLLTLGRSSPLAWEGAGMMAVFLLLTAFSRAQFGDPTTNRYIYVTVAILLVLLIGIAPEGGFGTAGSIAVVALACISIPVNLDDLHAGGRDLRLTSDVAKAELGAVEIARRTVDPNYTPPLRAFYGVPSAAYFAAIDRYASSPAEGPEDIAAADEHARERADTVLVAALPIRLVAKSPPSKGSWLCQADRSGVRRLTSGVIGIYSGTTAPTTVSVRRFADRYVNLGTVPARQSRSLVIPADLAPHYRWQVRLRGRNFSTCTRRG